MLTTTDEINLHRLLLSCEDELKKQPIDVWSASDKRKFATYVKYLCQLQEKSESPKTLVYTDRVNHLKDAISIHTMHVDVEKGIAEARLSKKKHLEELKQYESSDPEWLIELKQQEERLAEEELARKKKLLEEEVEEEEEELEEEKSTEPSSELRQRNTKRENETSNIEHVLQHHRQLHDELTTDLSKMAQQLKINSQNFGDTLSKDDYILKEAQRAVENNLERMTKERTRLDLHYSKSWGTSFMTFGVVLFVCIMFVLVFFTIKFLPKA